MQKISTYVKIKQRDPDYNIRNFSSISLGQSHFRLIPLEFYHKHCNLIGYTTSFDLDFYRVIAGDGATRVSYHA